MFSFGDEAEQRDLWHLAVPRRQEAVHRSDCRDQSRGFENCSLHTPDAWKWPGNSKSMRCALCVSSERSHDSSRYAMIPTTAPQVDGDGNKTEDNYENYNQSVLVLS